MLKNFNSFPMISLPSYISQRTSSFFLMLTSYCLFYHFSKKKIMVFNVCTYKVVCTVSLPSFQNYINILKRKYKSYLCLIFNTKMNIFYFGISKYAREKTQKMFSISPSELYINMKKLIFFRVC